MFTTDFGFEEVYPMKTKADAYDCLNQFCTTYGIPKHIVVDNAAEENWGDWNSVRKKFLLTQSTTEPGSPWQNRTEGEIKEHKRQRPQDGHGALLRSTLQDSDESWHVTRRMVDPLKNV
jgi:hypothetical protein